MVWLFGGFKKNQKRFAHQWWWLENSVAIFALAMMASVLGFHG